MNSSFIDRRATVQRTKFENIELFSPENLKLRTILYLSDISPGSAEEKKKKEQNLPEHPNSQDI